MDHESIHSDSDSDSGSEGFSADDFVLLEEPPTPLDVGVVSDAPLVGDALSSPILRLARPRETRFVRIPDRPRRPARQASTRTGRDFRSGDIDVILLENGASSSRSPNRSSSPIVMRRNPSPRRSRVAQMPHSRFPDPNYTMRRAPRADMYTRFAQERPLETPMEPEVLTREVPQELRAPSATEGALLANVKKHKSEVEKLRQTLQYCEQRQLARHAAKKSGEVEVRGEECPICMDALVAPGPVLSRCGHMFHLQCIMQSISLGKAECPMCRRQVHQGELVQVMTGIPQGIGGANTETIDLVSDDGGEEEREIADRTKKTLETLERVLGDWDVAKMVKSVDDVRRSVKRRWKEELDRLRVEFREQAALLLERKDEIRKTELDLKHKQTRIGIRETEINDVLADLKKKQSDLNLKANELEVQKMELAEKGARLNDDRDEARRERERLQQLIRQKMRDRIPIPSDNKLAKENDKLRKELERLKHGDENTSPIVISPLEDADMRKDAKRKREGIQPDTAMLFGGNLQIPSKINRPAPPRRAYTGLGKFVPKRPKVQRPTSGIAGGGRKFA